MSWGEIYNTSWWGVALDTARTVKARPDFFGSQLNLLTSEQPNLVTNGTFDTDSDWVLGTGWSIVDGKAVFSGIDFASLQPSSSLLTIGRKYKLSLTSEVTNGSFKVLHPSSSDLILESQSGSYSVTFVATSNTFSIARASVGFQNDFTIDNVSVQVARAELDQIEAKKCLADWIHTTALKDLNN